MSGKAPRISVPKLHSYKMKSGVLASGVHVIKDGFLHLPDADVDTILAEAYNKKYRDIVVVGIRQDNTYEIIGTSGDHRISYYRLMGAASVLHD